MKKIPSTYEPLSCHAVCSASRPTVHSSLIIETFNVCCLSQIAARTWRQMRTLSEHLNLPISLHGVVFQWKRVLQYKTVKHH